MNSFNLVGLALFLALSLLFGILACFEIRCKNAGGVPFRSQCVALPLIDLEKINEQNGYVETD